MDKEKLKTLLSQYRVSQGHATESKRFYDQMVAETEAELAEAEKPELRDLDFGIDHAGQRWIFIDGRIRWIEPSTTSISTLNDKNFDPGKKWNLRDIFADLAALSQTMTEFEMKGTRYTDGFTVENGNSAIWLKDKTGSQIHVDKNDLSTFIRNLQIMYATMKREKAKNG